MDELSLKNTNVDMINFATFLTNELRASSPYRTGNMQRSIALVNVDNQFIDIVISVDYASYVNEQEKHYHWIEKVIDRCARSFAENNVDNSSLLTGISYDVLYGSKGENNG